MCALIQNHPAEDEVIILEGDATDIDKDVNEVYTIFYKMLC